MSGRRRGRFVTLEGSEGVGKTSNLEVARAELDACGIDVVVTREPGGTPLAEAIRDLLLDVRAERVDPVAETLLMFAARAQHVRTVIEPALDAGRWVLCDRFTDATFAYQGGGRGVSAKTIETLAGIAHPGLEPDVTLYLDVAVDAALARIEGRDLDRFEREQRTFFEAVRNTYLQLADGDPRFRVIDASRPLADVAESVRATVRAAVAEWRQ